VVSLGSNHLFGEEKLEKKKNPHFDMCVYVCVCVRERERERERANIL
jgi:hypothetical protein